MDIESPFESDPQLSEPSKPRMRSLDNPAVFTKPLTAFHASPCNSAQNPFGLQVGPPAAIVIALVRMQFPWALARPARETFERRDCVNAGFEQHGVMPVGPADQHHQWDATGVYDDVPFEPQFPSVCRIGPVCCPPRGLETVEPSMNRFGHAHAGESASRDAIAPTPLRPANHAIDASMSSHGQNP